MPRTLMADNDDRSGLDLLTKVKNDIALEIGEMDPNDPLRSKRIKELHALTELSKSTKDGRNKLIYEKMDALARKVGVLNKWPLKPALMRGGRA